MSIFPVSPALPLFLTHGRLPGPMMPDFLTSSADTALQPHGFMRTRQMLWLRDRGALRDMVQITRTKGGRWSVRWGVDLTYCPAFRHGRLASKVEPHQATGDIIIDPLDSIEANTQWSATNLLGRPARRRIDRFVTGWTSLALRDLAELGDLEAIRNHFAAWNQKPVTRFGLANYIQSYLAWGLAGLATGNPQEGRMLINQFCETFGVSASHPVLLDAMAAFESQ